MNLLESFIEPEEAGVGEEGQEVPLDLFSGGGGGGSTRARARGLKKSESRVNS